MDTTDSSREFVMNIYKNGRMPTKEEYTKIWIDMINHIERLTVIQDE